MEDSRYYLFQVMQRYENSDGISFPVYYQNLHETGIDNKFIFAVVNAFDEIKFRDSDFISFPIELIVDYIQRTHIYYLQKAIPDIKKTILLLAKSYERGHPLVNDLDLFFIKYQTELEAHFYNEDHKLLPYVALLNNAQKTIKYFHTWLLKKNAYSITNFVNDHDDTQTDLRKIQNHIMMYHPPRSSVISYRALLSQLRMLEKDLYVHSSIEEFVLIPKALQLENMLIEKVRANLHLN
ncbi:hypothetical protein [Mucilaginibacter ginkgonis]|uniref:Regulator of cell morphogenesis and NO signaling n=1 Tax=Mucilaginibacter ginkgonis TaxID=2682091 RepID=A0A6I4IMP3_9SPHI|nr:hypothetical protein [Mucilaginibacter ginkgonis]QQL49952.1 hypothetical protein GO620_000435 [Mucilaginibacter ginkgonis]